MVWYGMVWYGTVWYGMVRYGMVRYGMVWYGMVRYVIACLHDEIKVKDLYKITKYKVFELWIQRYKHKTQKLYRII